MTTTENSIRRTYLSRFGIDLLEMTITENGVRIRLANGIRYWPVWNDNHRKPAKAITRLRKWYWPAWNDNHRKQLSSPLLITIWYLPVWNDNHRKQQIGLRHIVKRYLPVWNDNHRKPMYGHIILISDDC